MPSTLTLSIVIPTRNESANIRLCVESFLPAIREGWGEILVVDNFSTDDTRTQSLEFCRQHPERIRFIEQGPERSAQRNEGWRQAHGEYVFFVDADMRMPPETLAEIKQRIHSETPPDALFVREVRVGNGWWIRVRNFERSFYDATCIDALRVIKRSILEQVKGYDEAMVAAEDWDLDRRILHATSNVALTQGHLLHDERRLTFWKHLKKKAYYSGNLSVYREKWGYDAIVRKQFGFMYRFVTVFLEHGKWKKALSHPHYMLAIAFERACVGTVYAWAKVRQIWRGS